MSDSLKQDQQQPHPSLGVVTIHDACPAFAKYMVHLPAENKLVEPGYHDLHGDKVPVRREPGIVVRVLSGRSGDIEAIPRMSKYVLVTILDVDSSRRRGFCLCPFRQGVF